MKSNQNFSRTSKSSSSMPDLDRFMESVRPHIAERIRCERAAYGPDFRAVIEQVHLRSPKKVSAEQLEEYREDECFPIQENLPNQSLNADGDSLAQASLWLESTISSLRSQVEGEVSAMAKKNHRESAVAPARGNWGSRRFRHAYAALAIAACMIVGTAFAWDRLIWDRMLQGFQVFGDSELSQSVDQSRNEANWQATKSRGVIRDLGKGMVREWEENPDLEIQEHRLDREAQNAEVETIEVGPNSARKGDLSKIAIVPGPKRNSTMTRSHKSTRHRQSKPTKAVVDDILELDARAQKLWRLGDLSGAEKIFFRIVRLASRNHRAYADLAYGDLFVLARQRQRSSSLVKLWKAYLQRFPRGRFAEDARAGLCEAASMATRKSCWSDYLNDFSRGAHRDRARHEMKNYD